MIDKRALSGLLAMAAVLMASTMPQLPKGRALRDFDSEERTRRNHFDREAAWQKRLACATLTEEQRIWNDAVDAKNAAKKVTP